MKSKTLLCFCSVMALMPSCSKSNLENLREEYDQYSVQHGEIVLGEQLDNPYTTENVKSAFAALYPTKSRSDITTTDYYVRFLPKDSDELDRLKEMGVTMLDHPVDYSIVREGDYYHDPMLDEDSITWQYAVVSRDFEFPADIRYELLQECYIAENSPATKAMADVDWDAVEREAYRISGNADMISESGTKATAYPSGRITIVDDKAFGGTPVGLSGVKVQCNVFVKFASAYTDREGYYKIPKSFTARLRYRLIFKNDKGFSIGCNSILYPASVSTLGKAGSDGITMTVDKNSDRALFRRCAVNNAAYNIYEKCSKSDLNLIAPPSDLCFWTFDGLDVSSTPMLHHGTVMDKNSSNILFKIASYVVEYFAPDITLGTAKCFDFQSIYSLVVHEMAHACHFQCVGVDWWDAYIQYILDSKLSGGDMYGSADREGAGFCACGEMWAYYMESLLYKLRYGGQNPNFGSDEWFHPQIFTYLDDRGLSCSDLQRALVSDVQDMVGLREELCSLYPDKKKIIDQAFNRYGQ